MMLEKKKKKKKETGVAHLWISDNEQDHMESLRCSTTKKLTDQEGHCHTEAPASPGHKACGPCFSEHLLSHKAVRSSGVRKSFVFLR